MEVPGRDLVPAGPVAPALDDLAGLRDILKEER